MTEHRKDPFDLPPMVDLRLPEAMNPAELQHLLRQFSNLSGVIVERPSKFEPWMFTIEGALFIYGEAHFYGTSIDIRNIEGPDNFLTLVNNLNAAFEAASTKVGKKVSA